MLTIMMSALALAICVADPAATVSPKDRAEALGHASSILATDGRVSATWRPAELTEAGLVGCAGLVVLAPKAPKQISATAWGATTETTSVIYTHRIRKDSGAQALTRWLGRVIAHEVVHQTGARDDDGSALMVGHPTRDQMGQ